MEMPDGLDKCLLILLLRTVDCSQDAVASMVHCHKLRVGAVERWFRELTQEEAARLCDDQAIKRIAGRELVSLEEVSHEVLIKAGQVAGDDILRHYREDYLRHIEPKYEEQQEFLALLHRWREQVRFSSPDELLRELVSTKIYKDLLHYTTNAEPAAKIYDAAKRHHARTIPGPVRPLMGVEQEGLFQRLGQCYPDDPVWKAEDTFTLTHGAYIEAFVSWLVEVEHDLEFFLSLLIQGVLLERGYEPAGAKDGWDRIKKGDPVLLIDLRLATLLLSCDILTLGIGELPSNPLWVGQVEKLKILRSETMNKLSKDFGLARGEIDAMARLFWEHEAEVAADVREKTRNLVQKLQRLQVGHHDLHSKLTALEARLYDVAESQPS